MPNTLRTILTTTSALAIVALSHSNTIAAAAARQTTANNAVFSTGVNLDGGVPFVDASTLTITGPHNVDVDDIGGPLSILAVSADVAGGTLTINTDTSLGSVGGANTLGIKIAAGNTLTLTGTSGAVLLPAINQNIYGINDVDFTGVGAALTVESADGGPIRLDNTFANGNNGTLNVNTDLTVIDVSAASINIININAGTKLTVDVGNNDFGILTNALDAFNFTDEDSAVAFKIDAAGGKSLSIHNDFDPVAGDDNKGKLEFYSSAAGGLLTIAGNGAARNIGNANDHRLKELKISGSGDIQFDKNIHIFAKAIAIASTGEIEFVNPVDSGAGSSMLFAADGHVIFTGGATIANIDYKGTNAIIDTNALITGGVDDSVGGGNSTLNFIGAGGVTGSIGATNSLSEINFKAGGNAIGLNTAGGGIIQATTLTFIDDDQVTAHSPIIGNVNFNGTNGELNVQGLITGNVDDSVGVGNSTLNFTGAGGVTDSIGATNSLSKINFKAGGNAIGLNTAGGGIIQATTLIFIDDDQVTAHSPIIGNIDFKGTNGVLNVQDLITGNVDNTVVGGNNTLSFTTATGSVTGAIGATKALHEINVKNGATATLPNAIVNAATINIGEAAGPATLIRGGNVDFDINNGVTTVFKNADSIFKIQNNDAGADHTITLYGNLGGVADSVGKVELFSNGLGRELIIQSNAVETIGQGNAQRIKELIISGTEAITANTKIYADTLTLNNTSSVDFTNGLEQGTGGRINVNQSTTIRGNINGVNTILNLNNKTLTYNKGQATLTGNVVINTTIKGGGAGIGNVVVDGNGGATTLDLSGAASITINLKGTSDLADVGKNYPIIAATNGGTITPGAPAPNLVNNDARVPQPAWATDATGTLSNPVPPPAPGPAPLPPPVVLPYAAPAAPLAPAPAPTPVPTSISPIQGTSDPNADSSSTNVDTNFVTKSKKHTLNVEDGNKYSGWVLNSVNNQLVLMQGDNSTAGLQKDFAIINPEIIQAFAQVDPKSDAGDAVNTFGVLSDTPAVQKEAANRLSVVVPTESITDVTLEIVQTATTLISSRVDSIAIVNYTPAAQSFESNTPVPKTPISKNYAPAAGDGDTQERYGVWATPFYSKATQHKKGYSPGYRSKSAGGTIGFDFLANDNLTLGVAFTAVNTRLTFKNQKSGDSTKIGSKLFSIYAVGQLSDKWFIQAMGSIGSSLVRNNEKRIVNLNESQTAHGKYRSSISSLEVLGGYRYILPNINTMITPMLGLRYTASYDKSYAENGTQRRNLTVSKKSMSKVETVAGGRVSFPYQINEALFIPEIHGFVSYDLKGKAPSVEARLNGARTPMPAHTAKPDKTLFTLGTSFTLKHSIVEYGLGYDVYLSKKYTGHQGTLKLRANF